MTERPGSTIAEMGLLCGLDVLEGQGFKRLFGKSIAVVCNQASIDGSYKHILDHLLPLHRSGALTIRIVLGPQHGLFGHTQDNMIEWEGKPDARLGVSIASLYGATREPSAEMLRGIDLLLIDLPDVGSRYYTFMWTTYLCMRACASSGIPVLVLDRSNPIGGVQCEGPVLEPEFASFVGLQPLPVRHGLTIGELARHFQRYHLPECDLSVVPLENWKPQAYADELGAAWAIPSPNMPTVDTAVVYPGACLLEGTNLSEGRGTTRPFEIFGAPFLNGGQLASQLNALKLPGVVFRAIQFEPTFNKHAEQVCEGCFVHVIDRRVFEPVITYVAVFQEIIRQTGLHRCDPRPPDREFHPDSPETRLPGFAWRLPPYEYEYEKLPFDILAGNSWLREQIERLHPLEEIRRAMAVECQAFESALSNAMQYVR